VALGLGADNFAARSNAFMPLIWLTVIAPGVGACALLLLQSRPRRRRLVA
jgi:hypothetical protein